MEVETGQVKFSVPVSQALCLYKGIVGPRCILFFQVMTAYAGIAFAIPLFRRFPEQGESFFFVRQDALPFQIAAAQFPHRIQTSFTGGLLQVGNSFFPVFCSQKAIDIHGPHHGSCHGVPLVPGLLVQGKGFFRIFGRSFSHKVAHGQYHDTVLVAPFYPHFQIAEGLFLIVVNMALFIGPAFPGIYLPQGTAGFPVSMIRSPLKQGECLVFIPIYTPSLPVTVSQFIFRA